MTEEYVELNLGGAALPVIVEEVPAAGTAATSHAPAEMKSLAEHMLARFDSGTSWSQEVLVAASAEMIVGGVVLLVQLLNERRAKLKEPSFGPFEQDDVLAKCGSELSAPFRRLLQWAFEVRVGVRAIADDLRELVACTFLPKSEFSLRNIVGDVGQSHLMVAHVMAGKHHISVNFRGYQTYFESGIGYVGGSQGCGWSKNLWLTPGLRSMDAVLHAKEYGMRGAMASERDIACALMRLRTETEEAHKRLHIDMTLFPVARGQRLDLENRSLMDGALRLIRSLRALAVAKHSREQIRAISQRGRYSMAELTEAPEKAGRDEAALRRNLQLISQAEQYYHHGGQFILPDYYLCFDNTAIPAVIPRQDLVDLDGVIEKCYPATKLCGRPDAQLLVDGPSTLTCLEDFGPVIAACGVRTIGGRRVTDAYIEPRTASGEVVPEGTPDSTDWAVFTLEGERPEDAHEMPYANFLSKMRFQLVPQVVSFGKRRLSQEDLRWHAGGMQVGISEGDVRPKFSRTS